MRTRAPPTGRILTWQKNDPTTDDGAQVQTQTALTANPDPGGLRPQAAADYGARWMDYNTATSVGEAKHVKDRYFSSVGELAKVTFPGQYLPFVPFGEVSNAGGRFNLLLAIFDRLTTAAEFNGTDLTTSIEGTAVSPRRRSSASGPRITRITDQGVGGNVTNSEAIVCGKININAILDSDPTSPTLHGPYLQGTQSSGIS